MRKLFLTVLLIFICFSSLPAYSNEPLIDYEFGRGLKLKWFPLRVGGYLSVKYRWTNKDEFEFNFENLAVLLYGDISKRTRFFFELEARNLYLKKREIEIEEEYDEDEDDDDDDEEEEYEEDEKYREIEIEIEREFEIKPEVERIYLDYLISDALRLRVGKFITPIGIWNPIHIPPLKWTSIDPPAATDFFPRFTTGLKIYGLLPFQNESWEYSVFIQKTKGIDDRNNNVRTDNFYGLEIKKFFSDISVEFSIGKFKDLSISRDIQFTGISFDVPYRRFRMMSEFIYGTEKGSNVYSRKSYYIQGIYRVFSKNYLIVRNDYFDNQKNNRNIKAILVGWNYRPLYPISLKVEFQWKKDSLEGDLLEFATSFAVLF